MEVSGQLHTLAALTPRERVPDTHWIEGWMSPRISLDAIDKRKILPLIGIEAGPSMPWSIAIPTELSRLTKVFCTKTIYELIAVLHFMSV
jgi:hypothetical protein